MMEWDGGGRVIVKGTNIRGKTCYGGSYLIPTYEHMSQDMIAQVTSLNMWLMQSMIIIGL